MSVRLIVVNLLPRHSPGPLNTIVLLISLAQSIKVDDGRLSALALFKALYLTAHPVTVPRRILLSVELFAVLRIERRLTKDISVFRLLALQLGYGLLVLVRVIPQIRLLVRVVELLVHQQALFLRRVVPRETPLLPFAVLLLLLGAGLLAGLHFVLQGALRISLR